MIECVLGTEGPLRARNFETASFSCSAIYQKRGKVFGGVGGIRWVFMVEYSLAGARLEHRLVVKGTVFTY